MVLLTVAIPTLDRGNLLARTIEMLRRLDGPEIEILAIDQSRSHDPEVSAVLQDMSGAGEFLWLKQEEWSIPKAMNRGLHEARGKRVLFLDDDIIPGEELLHGHASAGPVELVAGQVLQPGENPRPIGAGQPFGFYSSNEAAIEEFMGGNFSVDAATARRLGGFDENFRGAAYRFEAEFAERALRAGLVIRFDPSASIRHLRAARGGTRLRGSHLTTIRPDHAVGAYYYIFRSQQRASRGREVLKRLVRSVSTRHHMRRPWYIPVTLIAEAWGIGWAWLLSKRGPALMSQSHAEQ